MNSEISNSFFISIIIPALNEAKFIARTINSIHDAMRTLAIEYEIVVVDNGSRDDTVVISRGHSAKTFVQPELNISELRNFGVRESKGNVIIFLDADVSVTKSWIDCIDGTFARIVAGEKLITGSHCAPPDSGNLLHLYWFKSFYEDTRNTHLGSAHMIMSDSAFSGIGGFDAGYRTGEDYDFCRRAKLKGYRIENKPELKVVHHDFPEDLLSFVAREAWHGRSDFKNFSSWVGSKVAVATSAFLLLHFILLLTCFLNVKLAYVSIVAILLFLIGSSVFKFRGQGLKTVAVNAGIFYFYYIGRAVALLTSLAKRVA